MKIRTLAGTAMLAIAAGAARPAAAAIPGVYLDVGGNAGYSSPTPNTAQGATSPTLVSYGLGGAAAWKPLPFFFIGAATDYTFTNQYSKVNKIVGNFSGKRWNMAYPIVGISVGQFAARLGVEIMGDYRLSYTTANGEQVAYQKPLGGRLDVRLPLRAVWVFQLGGWVEYLEFSKQKSSALGVRTLDPKFTLLQGGVALAFVF